MQFTLAMKLTAMLLFVGMFQVQARGLAQNVTYSAKGASLTQVFTIIKQQTGYFFFYSPDDLQGSKPVTCTWKDLPLSAVLDNLFATQPLSYEIQGNTVVVTREKKSAPFIKPAEAPAPPTIHGRVTDSLGNPLAGASVSVKGSKKGTQTDATGSFELKGVETGVTLVFSFTGYATREYKVHGETVLIMLSRSVSPLDEIKVIAYGQTTERFAVGNVTTVKAVDIEKQPVSNPLLALEGMVPGLFIAQASGMPGGGISVQIQGQNSIGEGNDPFYVVDGVPYPPQLLSNLGNALGYSGSTNNIQQGNPMSFINPSDIESISVLKDADATAIYGSRAANGAILITTKKGKAGKEKLDLNLQNGWGRVAHRVKLLNLKEYLQMRREALANDGLTPSSTDYDINGLWDTTRSTDWQKVLAGNTAQYTHLNGSMSGGNVNTQYMVGFTWHRETTVFPGDLSDQKGTVHFNISNASANQRFHLQLSGDYMVDNNRLINDDPAVRSIALAPDAPALYKTDGSLNWEPDASGRSSWLNPMSIFENKYHNTTNNLIGNAIVSYQVLPGWDIRSSFGYNNLQSDETLIFPTTDQRPENRPTMQGDAIFGNNTINTRIMEPQTTYKRKLGRGALEALAGATILETNSKMQQVTAVGYNSDQSLLNIAAASAYYANSNIAVYKYAAFFTRLNYNWDKKYVIELTARRDGSSRFGPANRYHDFAAAGLSWVFSEVQFVHDHLSFLSFGKLRGSYGTTGNDQIGDYQFLNKYYTITASTPYQGSTGLAPQGLYNPFLQWEETRKLSAGLDLGFVKDRVLLKVDYFRNRSSNELLGYALPIIAGTYSITKNFPATVQNAGLEISVNATPVKTRDFSWSANFNLTIPRNKLVAFPGLENSSYGNSLVIGKPVSVIRAYHFMGVDPATGVYQFEGGDGHLTTSPDFFNDRISEVNTTPRIYGGINNTLRYKGLELSFLFQFVKQRGPNYFFGRFYPGMENLNEPRTVLARWQKPGDITSVAPYSTSYNQITPYFNAAGSDAAFTDASYIRLKNFSLSWQMPGGWVKKAGMQSARVYAQGQNLLTFTRYIGIDPENQSSNAIASSPLRVFTLGLQFNW